MEAKNSLNEASEVMAEMRSILSDEEAAEGLSLWLSGYVTRARLEQKRKKGGGDGAIGDAEAPGSKEAG